jgi:hypothetical protein
MHVVAPVHVEQQLLQRAWCHHGLLHLCHALLVICTELASSYTLRQQQQTQQQQQQQCGS